MSNLLNGKITKNGQDMDGQKLFEELNKDYFVEKAGQTKKP
jgi:hypothetical protein